MLFAKAILDGKPIDVFNHGDMYRDFTYVGDVVEGVARVLDRPPSGDGVPYRLYNIGRGSPVRLMDFIGELEKALGRTAQKNYLPIQPGDVASTRADIAALERDFGYRPATSLPEGIGRFVEWYRAFFPAP
jgi:UDP-glucuronate 4-epimerase